MSVKLNTTILLRKGVFADSYVLQAGEPGFHTGTKVFKIGDGTTTWAELPYANQETIESLTGASITLALQDFKEENIDPIIETIGHDRESEIIPATGLYALMDDKAATAKSEAKSEIIGAGTDAKEAETIHGAKAYADHVADEAKDAAIEAVVGTVDDEATADTIKGVRKAFAAADAALDERLEKVEAFFVGAAEDEGEGENLKNALDTLKEIQDFATGEGTAATEMLDAIKANADAIDELEAKPAYGITATQITNWDGEVGAKVLAQGVKDVVDANKATWDKAGTAVQSEDFETWKQTNAAAIAAAEQAAKDYADLNDANTTYTVAPTANALEFTVTPSEGEAQTVKLVAPTVDVGVTKVTAGTDIVVTPEAGTGEVTVAHKDYSSGTLTKDPTALENGDAYVFTGLDLSNGHVTGGAMKSLADILSAMEFILDGGTAE